MDSFTILPTDRQQGISVSERRISVVFEPVQVACYLANTIVGNISSNMTRIKNSVHMQLKGNISITSISSNPLRLAFRTVNNPSLITATSKAMDLNMFPSISWSKPLVLRTATLGDDFTGMITADGAQGGNFYVYSSIDMDTFTTVPDTVYFDTVVSYYNPL
jgi:hypothetical protein